MRDVLVHYHLFKNAGSSIDKCLENSFNERWYAFDPDSSNGMYTANEMLAIIESVPEATAFSSHCIVPPVPGTESMKIHPIVVLREPISRVYSAYTFEWKKQIGLDKPKGSLAEYINTKFDKPRGNAIEEFQTIRLSCDDPDKGRVSASTSDETMFDNACRFINQLPAYGLVEEFSESLNWLQSAYQDTFPGLDLKPVAVNVTDTQQKTMAEKHDRIRNEIGNDLFNELVSRNQMDTRLYRHAVKRFHQCWTPGSFAEAS